MASFSSFSQYPSPPRISFAGALLCEWPRVKKVKKAQKGASRYFNKLHRLAAPHGIPAPRRELIVRCPSLTHKESPRAD